jgi:hypothetical protein
MQSPYGVFQTSPAAQNLMGALMKEVIALTDVMDVKRDKAAQQIRST